MNRILITDDNVESQYLLQTLLQAHGYGVELADHGAEALQKARQNPPDLIISDILMPVMDGFALCREWKKDERLRQIPMIFYTATYTDQKDRDFALGLGAEVFLSKPQEPDVLVQAIRETIQRIQNPKSTQANSATLSPNSLSVEFSEEDTDYLKQYNQTLIRRLEAKMVELEKANRELERDVAARRQSNETLKLQGSALNAAANAIIITDRQGTIQWVNPAWCKLTGNSEAEAVGQNLRLFKSQMQDDRFYQALWKTICSGDVWKGELVNKRKDGSHYTEEKTITPVKDEHGQITHFIGIKQDITERKKLERQFLRAQRMESIGTLAAGLAHDLNNILAPIMMSSALLRDKPSPGDLDQVISLIETNTQRATAIIKQLLTFGRGVSGEQIVVDLKHLIRDMEKIARETFPRNITITATTPKALLPVIGDATQLHQVLLNLCINARDAMPNGGTLSINTENGIIDEAFIRMNPEAKPGPCIRIKVSDTGEGIPPENMDKLFDPFFTTKEVGKGTGLGLSTVMGIVKTHNGFINVQSQVAKGTTFTICLPAAPEGQGSLLADTKPPLPQGHGELILLVDDENVICSTTRLILEKNGYRVLSAADGVKGLELFNQNHESIKLILADLMMPHMDGRALAKSILQLDSQVPVIISSGLSDGMDETHKAELKSGGVKQFLSKPYSAEDLLFALDAILHPHAPAVG